MDIAERLRLMHKQFIGDPVPKDHVSVYAAAADEIIELRSKLDSALARIEWFIQQLDIEQGAAKEWEVSARSERKMVADLTSRLAQREQDWLAARKVYEQTIVEGNVETVSLRSRLDAAEMFVREIVAWFDVIEQKADEVIMDEWPTDWLRRVRPAISGCGVERREIK